MMGFGQFCRAFALTAPTLTPSCPHSLCALSLQPAPSAAPMMGFVQFCRAFALTASAKQRSVRISLISRLWGHLETEMAQVGCRGCVCGEVELEVGERGCMSGEVEMEMGERGCMSGEVEMEWVREDA